MSYDYKSLLVSLLQELTTPMAEIGFKLRKAERAFEAKTSFGMKIFSLGVITHPGTDFDITGNIAIRFDTVQDLVNQFNTGATDAQKRRNATMGVELGNLAGTGQKRWNVSHLEDVRQAAFGILQEFRSIGLPYLEKYSDPRQALDVLGGNERANWLHMPVHGARCMRALALAYDLKDRERFDQIIANSRKFLEERHDFGLANFEALAAKLSSEFA